MSLRVLVCVSGELGFSTLKEISSKIKIIGVLTDSSSQKIINWAAENNLPTFIGNPRKRSFLVAVIKLGPIDILLSINYLFIIERDLIDIPRLFSMNIHGSKLPKYRGRAPHIWAIINGEKSLGITIHKIDEGCDTGDIILQKEIEINFSTTGGDLLKVFAVEYPVMLAEAIASIENDTATFKRQDHAEATYFGKRGPGDGEISWDWESERVLNWVRALTAPYPGAFTYFKDCQILIWKIEETEMEFESSDKNGKIIKIESNLLFIKVPNKILKITQFDKANNLLITVGDIFQGEKLYE